MIITSGQEFIVGKVYTEKECGYAIFEDLDINHYHYRFYVLRKSDVEEYKDYIRITFKDKDMNDFILRRFFYEISMD